MGEAPEIIPIMSWIHWGEQKARPLILMLATPLRKPKVAHVSCCSAATMCSAEWLRKSGEDGVRILYVKTNRSKFWHVFHF